jgi:flagellar motor protein MotB
MKRFGLGSLVAILAMSMLTTVGGCNKDKQRIVDLETQCTDLSTQAKGLRDELNKAKLEGEDLTKQLRAKDQQLASKDQEIQSLKASQGQRPSAATLPGSAEGWDVGRYADKVALGSDVLFAAGKADLSANGKKALDRIVGELRASYPGMPVRVYGYTDSDPIKKSKWRDNLDLSANRAMAVTRYLIAKGIKAQSIETVAMGATNFLTKNDSKTDKAKNRRVEIVVLKK